MSRVRSGVSGTPTFYINGVRHDGEWDAATLWAAFRGAALFRNEIRNSAQLEMWGLRVLPSAM